MIIRSLTDIHLVGRAGGGALLVAPGITSVRESAEGHILELAVEKNRVDDSIAVAVSESLPG